MSLTKELAALEDHFTKIAPPELAQSIEDVQSSFKPDNTIKVGDILPEFELSDATGKLVKSTDLIANGPVLITFYRGEWCPYCNLAMASLQGRLDAFKAKGVTLVGISPELPNNTLSFVEKKELKFPVLSDVGNDLARKLGLVWKMPEYMRPIFQRFGFDLERSNGDDTFELPVPTNILVDGKGVVRNMHVNPDYRKRLEPAVALEWADAL